MKTLKIFYTCLETLIKKFFFKCDVVNFNENSIGRSQGKTNFENDLELVKFEEYIFRYKGTTRWQTV